MYNNTRNIGYIMVVWISLCGDIIYKMSTKWTGQIVVMVVFLHTLSTVVCAHVSAENLQHRNAIINITYTDSVTGNIISKSDVTGRYAENSRHDPEYGIVVHVKTASGDNDACTPPVNPHREKWIALVERGHCKFTDKIYNSAVRQNASAVVIYDNTPDTTPLTMTQNGPNVDSVVSIFIARMHGEQIVSLVDNGTRVMMSILAGSPVGVDNYGTQINKTSVLFVSISFIVLMIISLAWLVFYYIQRFRYAHAKERLSKRLMHAAKKAISKMPARTLKVGDKEMEMEFDQCAICIESYKVSDVIRILPCKHVFHKSCVDPWLIEQRSCPMCKTDILMAYGLQIHGSRESIVNIEVEGPSTSLGPFESISADGLREFDHNGVEVIRFQPALLVHHQDHAAPLTVVLPPECPPVILPPEQPPAVPPPEQPPVSAVSPSNDQPLASSSNETFTGSQSSALDGAEGRPQVCVSDTLAEDLGGQHGNCDLGSHHANCDLGGHHGSCDLGGHHGSCDFDSHHGNCDQQDDESSNLLQVAAVSMDSLEYDNNEHQHLVSDGQVGGNRMSSSSDTATDP